MNDSDIKFVYNTFKKYGIDMNKIIDDVNKGDFTSINALSKLSDAINIFNRMYWESHYIEVYIMNREGSQKSKIKQEFPNYKVIWQGEPDTIGKTIVFVPAKDWNDELKKRLEKYDSFVGVHQDKFRRKKRDENGREIYNNGKYEYEEYLGEPYEFKIDVIDRRKFSKWEKFNEHEVHNTDD